jgi:hypothetical protein
VKKDPEGLATKKKRKEKNFFDFKASEAGS